MQSVIIEFKRLHADAIEPEQGTPDSACFDLFALEDVKFKPNEIKLVNTGWACQIEKGYRANIYVRSSTPLKKKFILANGVGIIDNDYRGDLGIQLMNVKSIPHEVETGVKRVGRGLSFKVHTDIAIPVGNKIMKGDKIAQLEIVRDIKSSMRIITELSTTERGKGGFGSTGL